MMEPKKINKKTLKRAFYNLVSLPAKEIIWWLSFVSEKVGLHGLSYLFEVGGEKLQEKTKPKQ